MTNCARIFGSLQLLLVVGLTLFSRSIEAGESCSYVVPMVLKKGETPFSLDITMMSAKVFNAEHTAENAALDYRIPQELTGDVQLFVRLKSTFANGVAKSLPSFPMSGAVSVGPCRWGEPTDSNLDLPICVSDINNADALAKARCQWHSMVDDQERITCKIEYSRLTNLYEVAGVEPWLRSNLDKADITQLLALAKSFGHEAIGVVSFLSTKR